jgi:hypothetical protein
MRTEEGLRRLGLALGELRSLAAEDEGALDRQALARVSGQG